VGEAKRRGSFEARKAQAVEREALRKVEQEELKRQRLMSLTPEQRQRQVNASLLLQQALLLASEGSTHRE